MSINLIYSQTKAKVQYKIVATGGSLENREEVKKSQMPNIFEGYDNALKNLIAELSINNSDSYYVLLPSMNEDNRINKGVRSLVGEGEYFRTGITEYIVKKNLLGKEFCVSYKSESDWKLTNETKIINGYTCFKATRNRISNIKGKVKSFEINAWYCPKISLNHGPKGYGALPGLILELQEPIVTFLATKIEFDEQNIFLKKIPCVPITEQEFDEKLKKTLENSTN